MKEDIHNERKDSAASLSQDNSVDPAFTENLEWTGLGINLPGPPGDSSVKDRSIWYKQISEAGWTMDEEGTLYDAEGRHRDENMKRMVGLGIKPHEKDDRNLFDLADKQATRARKVRGAIWRKIETIHEEGERGDAFGKSDPIESESAYGHGVDLMKKFKETWELSYLNEAIIEFKKAVESSSKEEHNHIDYLHSLASSLGERFKMTGLIDDNQNAINCRSILWDIKGKEKRTSLDMLEMADELYARYCWLYEISDLNEALDYYRYALEECHEYNLRKAHILWRLAQVYRYQFLRGRQDRLDKAIHTLAEAMKMVSKIKDQPELSHMSTLAMLYKEKFMRTHDAKDLNRAINHSKKALELDSEDHRLQADISAELGNMYQMRSKNRHSGSDLEKGIEYSCLAVELTPCYSMHQTVCLSYVGAGYRSRFERKKRQKDLNLSTRAFRKAFDCESGSPRHRVQAGQQAINNLVDAAEWSIAADIIDGILRLIPHLSPFPASREDLQYNLQPLSKFASSSASILLKAGRHPYTILKSLELSRGVIASQMMDAKLRHLELLKEHPAHYEVFEQLTNILGEDSRFPSDHYLHLWEFHRSEAQPFQPALSPADIDFHGRATRSYLPGDLMKTYAFNRRKNIEALSSHIRQLPGFERFLLPLTRDETESLSRDGPVICLNVSYISSEAYLITKQGIEVISLPNLRLKSVEACVKLFASKGNVSRRDAAVCEDDSDDDLYETEEPDLNIGIQDPNAHLKALWDNCVEPILQRLQLLSPQSSAKSMPRVWWVGSGLVSLLPLHAAGTHDAGSTENTMSYVISSYASSLKSLALLQRKPSFAMDGKVAKVLIVSMPTSPGHSPLQVVGEVEAIKSHTSSWASVECLERVPKRRVLHALKSCTVAHFACHGTADSLNPEKSALIVGREAEDRLTVEDLDSQSYTQSKVAYLSACSTAEISLKNMTDESINVAANFQLAGFQHVIGTLWGADDEAAARIASQFYRFLLRFQDRGNASVALALHEAVSTYRSSGHAQKVSMWAPFIHMGC